MNTQPLFQSHTIITLPHCGLCGILGITPNGHLYAEEIYLPDEQITHHILTTDGQVLTSAHELSIPKNLISPKIHPQTKALNYQGGRLRGLREAERLSDWVQPLPIADKMTLIQTLGLKISAMQLFGIVESAVLSSVHLHDDWFVVCRRIRLAIALPQIQTDADGLPYDYDNHIFQTAHLYHESWGESAPIEKILSGIGNVRLNRVYDCIAHENQLYISESCATVKNNAIHRWSIEYPA